MISLKTKNLAIFFLSLLLLSICLRAEEELSIQEEDNSRKLFSPSSMIFVRPLAMAEAVSPIVRGLPAVYYNPAHIGLPLRTRYYQSPQYSISLPKLVLTSNNEAFSLLKNIKSEKAFDKVGKWREIMLSKYTHKDLFLHENIILPVRYKGLIFVPYLSEQFILTPKPLDESLSLETEFPMQFRRDIALGVGWSINPKMKNLSFGFFIQAINRDEASTTLKYADIKSLVSLNKKLSKRKNNYYGILANLGLGYKLGNKARPRMSFVIKNLGKARYKLNKKSTIDPVSTKGYSEAANMTLGLSFSPSIGKNAIIHTVFEGRHLNQLNLSLSRKLAFGFEFQWGPVFLPYFLKLQAGLTAKGESFGLAFDFGLLKLSYAQHRAFFGLKNTQTYDMKRSFLLEFSVQDL